MSHVNMILNTDTYKHPHHKLYPSYGTKLYSYIESRGGMFDRTLMFGGSMFIQEYLVNNPVTKADVDEAEEILAIHFGRKDVFDRARWDRVVNVHGGYFPVMIKAIPEGYIVPTHNVLMTIEDLDDQLIGMGSHLETALLRAIWYPTTVATLSWHCKQIIKKYIDLSCDDPENNIDFRLHDFGARGVSSMESAGIGGAAHLINFKGTDTMTGIQYINKYYSGGIQGFSIPAAEHSVVTSFGRNSENEFLEQMLNHYPDGMIAAPCDSYDLYNMVNNIVGSEFKDLIKNRKGVFVVRPDSGSPIYAPLDCIEILGQKFGYTENQKGYKVLHPSVRVIQGDGINIDTIPEIYGMITSKGWSAENLTLGMGGGLLQQVNRDTQKFAMKASAIYSSVANCWVDVYKNPVTDPGKTSKKGRFSVYKPAHFGGNDFDWMTVDYRLYPSYPFQDMLWPVYESMEGKLYARDEDFQDVQERTKN